MQTAKSREKLWTLYSTHRSHDTTSPQAELTCSLRPAWMARSSAQSISTGGTLLASVSSEAITLWKTEPFASCPVAVIPAPESLSIASAALAPAGDVLAIVFGDSVSNPVLVLCHPDTWTCLFRLELPKGAESADQYLRWFGGPPVHSLLIPIDKSKFLLIDFCPGYQRIKSKKALVFKSEFGSPVHVGIVPNAKTDVALVFTYVNAIAVYSLPGGEPLVLKRNVFAKAIMKIVRTGAGFAALGLVESYSARVAAVTCKNYREQEFINADVSPTGIQDVGVGLVWAFIGNAACKAIAPLTNFRSEQILQYSTSCVDHHRLALFTDSGRVVFLDPFHSAGPLFAYRLPPPCAQEAECVSIAIASTVRKPLGTFVVLSHQTKSHSNCIHIVSNSKEYTHHLRENETKVIWSLDHGDPPATLQNSLCSSSPQSPPVVEAVQSVTVRLPLKPGSVASSMPSYKPWKANLNLFNCENVQQSSVPLRLPLKRTKSRLGNSEPGVQKRTQRSSGKQYSFGMVQRSLTDTPDDPSLPSVSLRLRMKPPPQFSEDAPPP